MAEHYVNYEDLGIWSLYQMNWKKILRSLGIILWLHTPLKHRGEFAFMHFGLVLSLHLFRPTLMSVPASKPMPTHPCFMSLSCSRGSPSHGGILTQTLLLCAACSPDAAWNLSPARLHSCTWSSRIVRWESHTWPSPWGCAALVWGCSMALAGEREKRWQRKVTYSTVADSFHFHLSWTVKGSFNMWLMAGKNCVR